MSTRSNVIIVKSVDGSNNVAQLYRHHDSYPKGLGIDFVKHMEELHKLSESEMLDILSSPEKLALWLEQPERKDEFEFESDNINIHGDIEYLYVINLDDDTITCHKIIAYRISNHDVIDILQGDGVYNRCFFPIYKVCMWIDKDKMEAIAEKTNNMSYEEWSRNGDITDESSSHSDWFNSDLVQIISEKSTISEVINKASKYMHNDDFREFLIELADEVD